MPSNTINFELFFGLVQPQRSFTAWFGMFRSSTLGDWHTFSWLSFQKKNKGLSIYASCIKSQSYHSQGTISESLDKRRIKEKTGTKQESRFPHEKAILKMYLQTLEKKKRRRTHCFLSVSHFKCQLYMKRLQGWHGKALRQCTWNSRLEASVTESLWTCLKAFWTSGSTEW